MNRALIFLLAGLLGMVVAAAGCTPPTADEATTTAAALQLAPADTTRVLDFVNYPVTDEALLHDSVGLDSRAAANIIKARNGADGVSPSADDQPFTTLAALDAVAYVGDTALSKLASYSAAHPAPASITLETVAFAGWQVEAVLYGANSAPQADLDALLDSRSVTYIMAHRPLPGLPVLAAVPYVGASALGKLRDHALLWWAQVHSGGAAPVLAGTFDGVTFDETTAKTALDIANQATYSDMTMHGLPAVGAAPIVGNRPYTTLAQVSAVASVGPATMSALKAYAQSGTWGNPAACLTSFEDAAGPALPQLLFLSESDRPFDLLSFPGKGTSTLTPAGFFALLQKPAGYTYEVRDVSNFYVALEPASSTADPNAAAAVQAAFGPLKDVQYIAVHKPDSDPYHSEVDVYLVGRTTCGDIVGIHSVAVET